MGRTERKPHDPPRDFVERAFENDSGPLVMKMADRASSHFGSRKGGRHIRRVVENLLRDHPAIVQRTRLGSRETDQELPDLGSNRDV